MRFCTSCGESLRPGTGFCTECGARVVPGDPGPGAAPDAVTGSGAEWTGNRQQAARGVLQWDDEPGADGYPPSAYYPAVAQTPQAGGPRHGVVAAGLLGALALAGAAGFGITMLLAERDEPPLRLAAAPGATGGADADTSTGDSTRDGDTRDGDTGDGRAEEPAGDGTAPPSPEAVPAAPTAPASNDDARVQQLHPVSMTADCIAPPSQDSAGRTITYEPERVADGVRETAWRCTGSSVGQRLVLRFAAPVTVTSVGLVPGYDKVDPFDGIDRFTENRTVTGVAWRFEDGTARLQDIPNPTRDLARVPLDSPVRTTSVVMEITGTGNDGARRDYTAVSEVEVLGY